MFIISIVSCFLALGIIKCVEALHRREQEKIRMEQEQWLREIYIAYEKAKQEIYEHYIITDEDEARL